MRGDVVILDFPFTNLPSGKIRPGLVVQNDADNARRRKTIVAMITGNLRMAGDAKHLLVDPSTTDGASSGLHGPSLVSCGDHFTVEQDGTLRTIGYLSSTLMPQVDE
jgi:mRNA interferase MazF